MNRKGIGQLIRNRAFPGVVAAACFTALLAGTLLVLEICPPERERRLFWFPDSTRSAMQAEFRFVPRRDTRTGQIRLYLEELALGPARMGSVPFFPRGVRISGVVLDDRQRLYIDFSSSLVVRMEEGDTSFEDIVEAVSRGLMHNFPFLEEIVFTIGGQVPNVPRFGILPLTKDRRAL